MQAAIVYVCEKPTQRNRFGEIPDGLPGSSGHGMHGEKRRRTWETPLIPALSKTKRKARGRLGTEGETRTQREGLAPKRGSDER